MLLPMLGNRSQHRSAEVLPRWVISEGGGFSRDCILGGHLTDDLADFGVPYDPTDNLRLRRAISWKYQAEIYNATPKPRRLITVRFEDFVLQQEATLARLEAFLGVPLARIPVKPEAVGRWRADDGQHDFDFLHDEMAAYGYDLP